MTTNSEYLFSGGGAAEYQIERSVRFNSADSAHLSRTPEGAGNRKTWTWAGWVKRSALGAIQAVFSLGAYPTNLFEILFNSDDTFLVQNTPNSATRDLFLITTALYRDASAWYHVVVSVDTTQATSSNRVKIYINGVQVTAFSTETYPGQNTDLNMNTAVSTQIGRRADGNYYFNGYLADIHFIDGQALDPTSFGKFDTNGVWQPKAYSGTYGTNGFHLPFSDNSTAAALGTDTSGNGNDWSPTNLAATPVNSYQITGFDITKGGGAFANSTLPASGDGTNAYHFPRANNTYTLSKTLTATTKIEAYCYIDGSSGPTIQANGGSAIAIPAGSNYAWSKVNLGVTSLSSITLNAASWSGRDFWLSCFIVDDVVVYGTPALAAGNDSLVDTPTNYGTDTGLGGEVRGNYATLNPLYNYASILSNGNLDWSTVNVYGQTAATLAVSSGKWYWEVVVVNPGLVLGIKDASTGFGASWTGMRTYYSYNGNKYTDASAVPYGSNFTGGDVIGCALDLDAGTLTFYRNNVSQGTAFTGLTGSWYPCFVGGDSSSLRTATINTGQRPFAYTAPSGFKALCTQNLPDPTIADGSTAMDVVTYTGNSSTQNITGLAFSPDLAWVKGRAGILNHVLSDTIRGANLKLASNNADAEAGTDNGTISAFNSDGITVAVGTGSYPGFETNHSSYSYVGWFWDAGSSTVTNTDGTITSQVRANPSAGFSIVTYTGNGSTGTVGHGLGVSPAMIIQKPRSSSGSWAVYHTSLGAGNAVWLNLTDASGFYPTVWNNTAPTSSVYSVGSYMGTLTYAAYCFAPVEGYSAFGSYTGNGSADGPFVYTGFSPRWIMLKRTDAVSNWFILDTARNSYNLLNVYLSPDLTNAEATSVNSAEVVSSGFKVRGPSTYYGFNVPGGTYIYAAFAESPFKTARAR